ncbi:unnamed protein product [Linum trigynum]|uniref:Uncharacterized protein n=1 Tax=Linum trigynum TaxID=586398 RepID=A0AAV2DXY8_9ROSI
MVCLRIFQVGSCGNRSSPSSVAKDVVVTALVMMAILICFRILCYSIYRLLKASQDRPAAASSIPAADLRSVVIN